MCQYVKNSAYIKKDVATTVVQEIDDDQLIELTKRLYTLNSTDLKKAAFGEDCDTNLKVVAREGDKPTLDNTCQHTYALKELQNISVLVKALQKNNNKIDEVQILDVDNLEELGLEEFIDSYIAPPFSTSCHRYDGSAKLTSPCLLYSGCEVLYFKIDQFWFRCYIFRSNIYPKYRKDNHLFISDIWGFTENKQVIAQSSTLTKILLDSLGYTHDKCTQLAVLSDPEFYVNRFSYTISDNFDASVNTADRPEYIHLNVSKTLLDEVKEVQHNHDLDIMTIYNVDEHFTYNELKTTLESYCDVLKNEIENFLKDYYDMSPSQLTQGIFESDNITFLVKELLDYAKCELV